MELGQTVEICKELSNFFEKKRVKVIRIGLQSTDEIMSPEKVGSQVVAGPYHENLRQLVTSSYYFDLIESKIKKINTKVKEIEITVNPHIASDVVGYKRENVQKIKELYNVDIKIKQDWSYNLKKINVKVSKTFKDFADDEEMMRKKKKIK